MKEYLKMADVTFSEPVTENNGCIFSRNFVAGFHFKSTKHPAKAAHYVTHAINSHDELVAEVERLRGAIHDAFIDGCQVGWDMTGEGYNAEYGGPDDGRLHDEFAALFAERCADK